jgi:hypothetical protein
MMQFLTMFYQLVEIIEHSSIKLTFVLHIATL